MSKGHKSHRRKPEEEADKTPLLDDEGNPKYDADGNPLYEEPAPEEPVDPKDTEECKAFMAACCTIACGIEELTKRNCPAPDAARICETVWCHQNGATIKSFHGTE